MRSSLRTVLYFALLASLCAPAWCQTASIRRVKVLGSKDAVEIEIEASDRIVPQTQVLTGPDRLVVDFPNAVPGSDLRPQPVNRGEVKSVRVGLFQKNPPITRLVLDLKSPQSYQIFPYGRTVMMKVTGADKKAAEKEAEPLDDFPPATRPGLVTTNYVASAERVQVQAPVKLDVSFRNGLLSIKANKASLSEVLFAVHQRTGAEVAVAAGAEQEQVVADIGPAPAAEVLAHLLNGSHFNFLILNSPNDPKVISRVILSPRAEGAVTPLPPMRKVVTDDDDDDAPVRPDPPVQTAQPPANAPAPPGRPFPQANQPESKAPPEDNNTSDQ
jgi:hypothetical protein